MTFPSKREKAVICPPADLPERIIELNYYDSDDPHAIEAMTGSAFENEWQTTFDQISDQRQGVNTFFKNTGVTLAKPQPLGVDPLWCECRSRKHF